MPGLADMHVHLPGGAEASEADMQRWLALLMANGITTIRNMQGEVRHLTLRSAVAQGSILGPTIHTAGPDFNGGTATAPAASVQMVRQQRAAGYDFLKLNPGLSSEVFEAIVAEADRLEMPYAGHVPGVGLERVLSTRYRSIEHLDGYVPYAVPDEAGVDRTRPGFFGLNVAGQVDARRLASAVSRTKQAHLWIVPTLALVETFVSSLTAAELSERRGVAFLPERRTLSWP